MSDSVTTGILASELVRIARGACESILKIKRQAPLNVAQKADQSPVTDADLAASNYILTELLKLEPSIPAISEELIPQFSAEPDRYWLIDPLDGTREFVKGSSEYTVNIALIENHEPVFGVIAVPETGEVFSGGTQVAATASDSNDRSFALACRKFNANDAHCLISASHKLNEEAICRGLFQPLKISNVGSSLKYMLIASGKSDFSFRKTPTSIWDTAAAHAILRAAGGEMLGPDGKSLFYSVGQLINPVFIAVGDPSRGWEKLVSALAAGDHGKN